MLFKKEKPASDILQFFKFLHPARDTVQIVNKRILHPQKDRRMGRNDKLTAEKTRRIMDMRTKLDLSADR